MKRLSKTKQKLVLMGLFLLLLVAIIFTLPACEPGGFPIIENQRNQDIRIYILLASTNGAPEIPSEPRDYGIVPARTTKELKGLTFIKRTWVFRIEAKDLLGNIVFSHDYNMDNLENIDWKITIPP